MPPLLVGGVPIFIGGVSSKAPPRRFAAVGDSTGNIAGSWPAKLAILADNHYALSGVFYPAYNGWSYTLGGNAWSVSTPSDAFDVNIFSATVLYGSGSAKIATFLGAADSFDFYYVDGTGAATPSYSIDGGAFVDFVGLTLSGANLIRKIHVEVPFTTSFRVRCANAAGTSATTYLIGIRTFIGPNGAFEVNNVCHSADFGVGIDTIDRYQWWDLDLPQVVTIMFSNDVLFWDVVGFVADFQEAMDAFIVHMQAIGAVPILMNYAERNDTDITNQAEMRQLIKDTAVTHNLGAVIDFYDLWGNYAAANAAGFITDGVHPTNPVGIQSIADNVWRRIARMI